MTSISENALPLFAEINEIEQKEKHPVRYTIKLQKPSLQDLKEAVFELKNKMETEWYPYQKIEVTFEKPTQVRVNRRKVLSKTNMTVNFFEAHGKLCYTFYSRSGYYVHSFDYWNICMLSIKREDCFESKREKKINSLLNRVHPNAWPDLTVDSIKNLSLQEVYMKGRFPKSVLKEIEKAFEEKKNYHYSQPGTQRDLSVQVKVMDDGYVRAWYSSEYSGTGNGDYYLLINPHLATFGERD